MKKKSIVTLAFVIVIAIALNYVAFFGYNIAGFTYGGIFDEDKGIRKGIDLAGGSVITFQADTENPSAEDMNTVEARFQTRMTGQGYTEARISSTEDGKVTVEIPSVFDTDSAAELLGAAGKLTFVDADKNVIVDGQNVKDAVYRFGKVNDTSIKAEPHVVVEFDSEAQAAFATATEKAAAQSASNKNYISIMMDDQEISSPRVSQKIDSSSCVISGNFTTESAKLLANQIKSGSLPFGMTKISQETVGAELGATALPKSLLAAGIGICLILIFMVIIYRIPGLIADLSLLIYVGLIALFLGVFRINLSLSGIAGIVLSIGMAVDANVIIFERMKEELRLGKTIKAGVEAGFHKAVSAILDSNVTTIITCVVLYLSGIGAVTGFATTLGLGVVISMFTAIIVTKFLLRQLVNIGVRNRALFYSQKKKDGGAE